ncbi:hypothetical protein G6F31_019732 [Rhizopus arrhizus]|nr:hypothetical protein G6F31_019732 [Rhizopus arrhizus]
MPHTYVVLAAFPGFVLRAQAHHRAALRTDQVVAGNTHRPTQPRRHPDNLVGRMRGLRPPQALHARHGGLVLEQLHADDRGLQAQQLVQVVHQRRPIKGRVLRCLFHSRPLDCCARRMPRWMS